MYKSVKIGEKDVPMLAMASVNVYYKRVFGVDPIVEQGNGMGRGEAVNFALQMGFIMAMMAEKNCKRADMLKLNEDAYLDWLDGFDNGDLIDAIQDIITVYNGQNKTKSREKKEDI